MKKLGKKLVIFVVTFFAIDISIGIVFDYMQKMTCNNKTGHLLNNPKDDLVILGSSKAEATYSPKIFKDCLGFECYNYGCPGNGIILMYGRIKLITEGHMPKFVIYDILPQTDIDKNDNSKYINNLKPIYYNESIKEYIDNLIPNEKYKMLSSLYRYNSNFMDVLKSYLTRNVDDPNKGYKPAFGFLKYDKNVNKSISEGDVDSVKYYYMESLIREYKDKTKLVFVFSPRFKELDDSDKALRELFNKYDVTYLDCQQMEPFFSDKDYWNDGVHMNAKGAEKFSRYIASVVKHL